MRIGSPANDDCAAPCAGTPIATPSASARTQLVACMLHFWTVIRPAVFRHETTKSRNHEKDLPAFVFRAFEFSCFRGCLSVLNQRRHEQFGRSTRCTKLVVLYDLRDRQITRACLEPSTPALHAPFSSSLRPGEKGPCESRSRQPDAASDVLCRSLAGRGAASDAAAARGAAGDDLVSDRKSVV